MGSTLFSGEESLTQAGGITVQAAGMSVLDDQQRIRKMPSDAKLQAR